MAETISDASFEEKVLQASLPTLVDFWGPGCGPCSLLAPVIDTLAEKTAGLAEVYKINVRENPETAARFDVRSVPTVIVFEEGEEKARFLGMEHPMKYLDALGLEV